ncbi:MAG: MBOAT family protein, partial [Blautia sp.]|nr:MBOAT family protein [Blautia sp.]
MTFSSISFICVFFPVVFVLHWFLPGIQAKNVCLILASLLFYAYGEPVYVLLMIVSAFVNYLLGLILDRRRSRLWLWVAVFWNMGILAVFKYAGFVVSLLHQMGLSMIPVPAITLPIGISFFTFQIMSYVIDVYRGTVEAQKNYGKILLYIAFFPQLIAGPIVKYHDVERSINSRTLSVDRAAFGMRRFVAGLSKKVLLANTFALAADTIFAADAARINICSAWIGAFSYLLQIYFDFSGYSDMALGMAEMFGFRF